MATGQTASTFQTVFGIAPETQPPDGTPVVPTQYAPVKKLEPTNKPIKLNDESWRGSMVQVVGVQQGPQSAEVAIGGDAFPDTLGFFLAGILGDVVTTGAAAPFTHVIALENGGNGQPQSYTITDSDPLSTRAYASSRFTELTLKWDAAELLTYDATAIGWVGAIAADPTQSYSTLLPAASWRGAASVAGSPVPNLKSLELSFKRDGSEPIFTVQNDANPYEVHVGPITVEANLVWVASNEQPLLDYLANTTQALAVDLQTGAGATLTQVQVAMSAFNYSEVKKSKGNSWIEFETSGLAVGNLTDAGASGGYSPCKATLQNAYPAATYVTP